MAQAITDTPPAEVRREQERLAAALDRVVPPKRRRRNLMLNFADGLIRADSTLQLSWRISDHFPLWVEFDMRPPA